MHHSHQTSTDIFKISVLQLLYKMPLLRTFQQYSPFDSQTLIFCCKTQLSCFLHYFSMLLSAGSLHTRMPIINVSPLFLGVDFTHSAEWLNACNASVPSKIWYFSIQPQENGHIVRQTCLFFFQTSSGKHRSFSWRLLNDVNNCSFQRACPAL